MAGIRALRKIQLGREVTAGTAVAASTIWRGRGVIEDQQEVVFPEEDIGYLSGVDRSYIPKLQAAVAMDEVEATFEQLPHLLEAGIKTVTPVQDGAGTDYIYTYNFPTTAVNTLKTYTIEGGDNQQEEEMEYGFVESFTLSGRGGQALMMGARWLGRQVTASTFTGSLSLPAVDEILFSKGKLYIDPVTGNVGTTQKTSTLLGMRFSANTGLRPVWTADGTLYFTMNKCIGPQITCELTFEHDGTATAEKTAWRAETGRLIQVKFEGPAVTTPGTTYTYKTLILNMAGKWRKFSVIGEQDGNDIVTGTFKATYNASEALFCDLIVVNELSALP